jgi:tripartite ATP-independent transporter DctM subunit
MEWWLTLTAIFGGTLFLMALGLPIAFCLILIGLIGAYTCWGGAAGLQQFIFSVYRSISTFTLLPVPLFILMGEVMFRSGMAPNLLDAINKWIYRLPGRLSCTAVASGTAFAVLTGNPMASTAMLGELMLEDMRSKKYSKSMIIGPILASGGLAFLIPPSDLAVLLGSIGNISIGDLLISIIIPGLMLGGIFGAYIVITCRINPSLAPDSGTEKSYSLLQKLQATVKYILPLGLVIFAVIGVIFVGVCTPSEAAATGALACFVIAAAYKRLDWKTVRLSLFGTLRITTMVFMILVGALAYSQILSFSGATKGLIQFVTEIQVRPMFIFIAMQAVIMFLGMFMEVVSMMMITLPIFMPITQAMGFDPVWFGTVYLVNVGIAIMSPPFGLDLFTLKAVAPYEITLWDIYRHALPFIGLQLIVLILVIAFPQISLWLPSLAG